MHSTRIPPRALILGISATLAAMTFGASAQPQGNGWLTVDVPGAIGTEATAINGHHVVAGVYFTVGPVDHGFVRTPDGTLTASIDFEGNIAGYYVDATPVAHGFVRDAAGNFHKLDAPGATNTYATMIGPTGKVVGYSDNAHGFRLNRHVWQNAGP